MENQPLPDFIIIDDDPINNIVCSKIIKATLTEKNTKTFTDPEEALEFILTTYDVNIKKDAVIFLDINMPILTGWEVLQIFEKYPETVKQHFRIFMLSSSVDLGDKQKAENNTLVTAYIEKPLSRVKLQDLFPV